LKEIHGGRSQEMMNHLADDVLEEAIDILKQG
jgi:hypothetical protein